MSDLVDSNSRLRRRQRKVARALTFMSDSVGAHSGSRRRRKLGKRAQTFLPDDVVIDILSRLHAKDVLRCRCVCKLWRDLTSTRDFIDLHIRRSIPMILKDDRYGRVLLDRCWEPAQTRSKIHKLPGRDHKGVVLSQNGLIVVTDRLFPQHAFIIYNPIYNDVVKIKVPARSYNCKGRVCGVFFHPVQKEYCILWQKILSLQPCKVQYRILNLESDPKWRDIATQNVRILDDVKPLLIDKHLYWIVDPFQRFDDLTFNCEIMEYDIIKEEFRLIPCPVRVDYENVNLLDSDGILSLIHVIPSKESVEINVWTLCDGGEQLWASCNHVFRNANDLYSGHSVPKAIALRNGELVLQSNIGWLDGRLYVCNLEFGTFRKFGGKYKSRAKFLTHVTSLVSLKNCKSKVCMADE